MQKRIQNVVPACEESKPEPEEFNSPLLYDEPPLQVLPGLAQAIGLEEAIIVQQLHYLLRKPKNGRTVNGEKWIFNTYEQWQSMFPWWSLRTVRRIFEGLEKAGIIITTQPEGRISRRKYYRLNLAVVHRLKTGAVQKHNPDVAKLDTSKGPEWPNGNRPKWPLPSTESTSKGTLKEAEGSKGTASHDAAVGFSEFPSTWKPITGTKAQKLARIKLADKDYPSEQEFESFVEGEQLDGITCYRSDLYLEMCDRKWHEWRPRAQKWRKINDWKAYVRGLDDKIATAND